MLKYPKKEPETTDEMWEALISTWQSASSAQLDAIARILPTQCALLQGAALVQPIERAADALNFFAIVLSTAVAKISEEAEERRDSN